MTRALNRIGFAESGTSGWCAISVISGATSACAVELAVPGVPPDILLGAQFCPDEFGNPGATSSIDAPPPSASQTQSHPRWPLVKTPRVSVAQSPSSP